MGSLVGFVVSEFAWDFLPSISQLSQLRPRQSLIILSGFHPVWYDITTTKPVQILLRLRGFVLIPIRGGINKIYCL